MHNAVEADMVPKYDRVLRHAQEALLAKASGSAQTIVLVTDADGLTRWANGTFASVMGYGTEDIAGRMPGEFLEGPATDPQAAAAIGRALRAAMPIETRILNYKKNGAVIWLDLEILPFFDEAAELAGFVYVGHAAGEGEAAERAPDTAKQFQLTKLQQKQQAAGAYDGVSGGGTSLAECLLSAYPYKVLVAEDHPINLKLVVALLQAAGCEARCASNGVEALEELERASFDLIVMDSQMPVMTGIEAIAIIRSRHDWKRCTPILSLTAHAMRGAEEYHTSAGADVYMSKPLRSDCFIGAVKGLAQRGRDLREKNSRPAAGSLPAR
jgi:PAS domain S-box-containing protein